MRSAGPTEADSTVFGGFKGYLVALLAVGVALACRLALDPLWGDQRVFFIFYLAAITTMCVSGGGPGLLATILGLFVGTWFFVSPRHSLLPALVQGWMNTLTYLVSSTVVLLFVVRAQRALARERANT